MNKNSAIDGTRYEVLDGLRGVAAVAVLCYHIFEAIAFSAGAAEQQMFHGFLAVDFFFILSGFVMGYAYDHRWTSDERHLTIGSFIRLRLIRLHPMVVMGVLLGVLGFCLEGCLRWDGSCTPLWQVGIVALFGLFLLPTPLSLDARGNTEAFSLNGPHWSLFFEYIGSLLYALLLRRLSTRNLALWVALAGVALLANGLCGEYGTIAYGWSSEPMNLFGGALRMLFAYPIGLLLSRFHPGNCRHPQTWSIALAAMLLLLLNVPCLHGWDVFYEIACIILFFPLIVWQGARCLVSGAAGKVSSLMGRLSYPLYAIHYPLIYMYIHWLNAGYQPFGASAYATPVAIFFVAIAMGFMCLFFYEDPVRRWLKNVLAPSRKA